MENRTLRRAGVSLLVLMVLVGAGQAQEQKPKYEPVKVVSTSGMAYPPNTRTPGMVTLDVAVDASGTVQKVTAQRDTAPLTAAAEESVRSWQFAPATMGGTPIVGLTRVDAVFNPFNPSDVSIPNKPLPPPANPQVQVRRVFQPADVSSANYAVYPPNTVASGAVVLDVTIGTDGSVKETKVLQGVDVLAASAQKAVGNWQFTPATYEGKAVESHEVVAFVFVKPEIGTM